MRGRTPKPAATHALNGNPGKRKRRPDKAAPPDGTKQDDGKSVAVLPTPDSPEFLSPLAREEWHRLAPDLVKQGLLRRLDMSAFAARCEAYSTWMTAKKVVDEKGQTYQAGDQIKVRPEVKIADAAMRHMARFDSVFGLTPADRARVAHVTGGADPGKGDGQQTLPLAPTAQTTTPKQASAAPRSLKDLPDEKFFHGPNATSH